MRLFIAIDLPDDIKNYLRVLQREIPHGEYRLTSDFHLTLKFLGSVDEKKKQEVEGVLKKIPFQPFTAELSKAGVFLFRGNPRVVWVSMQVPDWLKKSQQRIEEKLEPLGFTVEHRFSPHITLARVKSVEDPKTFQEAIEALPVEAKQFSVTHFSFFQSHVSPKGATHEKLTNFP